MQAPQLSTVPCFPGCIFFFRVGVPHEVSGMPRPGPCPAPGEEREASWAALRRLRELRALLPASPVQGEVTHEKMRCSQGLERAHVQLTEILRGGHTQLLGRERMPLLKNLSALRKARGGKPRIAQEKAAGGRETLVGRGNEQKEFS